MVQHADIIEDFFEVFSWETEEIYDEIIQKQIELSLVFLKNMYEITLMEFHITKKTSEDFKKITSEKIKNIQNSVFEHNCTGDDVLISLKSLYKYLLENYINLRNEEFGTIFDKWAKSGHISGGAKTKEEKYLKEKFEPFLIDWLDGVYADCSSYLDAIEEIKQINGVGGYTAKRMYREASKIKKRKETKKIEYDC